jgi:hypothetical protein
MTWLELTGLVLLAWLIVGGVAVWWIWVNREKMK